MQDRFQLIFLLVPVLFAAPVGCSGPVSNPPEIEMNRLTAAEVEEGWLLLFDGETLQGWEDPTKETPPGGSWVVEDGCIKGTDHPRLREDLFTLESFADFELVFDWKISSGGNSGVKYRVQDRAVLVEGRTDPLAERFEDRVEYELRERVSDRGRLGPRDRIEEYVVAFEYQVIDDERHPDAAEGPTRTAGAIYGLAAPASQAARPAGEFNSARIRLEGQHVEHWLNGVKVVDVELDSESVRAGLEERWGPDSLVYDLLTEMPRRRTPIVLQHHNDEVWFRNLKVRRLD